MSSSSVSFRISRHTQDLAETVHALSQRLVTMEQRLESLEGQLRLLREQPRQAEEAESAGLAPIEANIERLLQDCRQLLAEQPSAPSEVPAFRDAVEEDLGAACRIGAESSNQALLGDDASAEASEEPDADEDDLTSAHAA